MPDVLRRAGPPHPVAHVDPPRACDPRFMQFVGHDARLVLLYDQATFSEGPVWWPAREMLVWSDVEGRRVLGWREDGRVEVVVDATPFINGHAIDRDDNLIHCEHGTRRLSRTTPEGHYDPLIETFEGRRFNSPDDVVCAADGALWFTDPSYGLVLPKQGALAEPELDHRSVYRFDAATYPWGPHRRRYHRRAHEVNAAGKVLARGAEAMGIDWTPTPLATVSAPRGDAPPCVYRGFCTTGCSTNAKQSVLVTYLPRALKAGAEIRDLAMVGRIETRNGRATGVHYHREGKWRFQRAKTVVVAGYAIEPPRLLLNSANQEFPDGLANSSGLVGKNLMVQGNQAVRGVFDEEIRSYKGPPSLSLTEHWNYDDKGWGDFRKDFHGGYCYMSQGPLPQLWANTQASAHGLWGEALVSEMQRYNHVAGLKVVSEYMPQERNRVTLSDGKDQYGLPVARITYSWCDNDKSMARHGLRFMRHALETAGGREIWDQENDTCHLNGTARMGDDPRTSVVDADCRSWDIPNLWVCDGSVFPTTGGVNPSLTIQAVALRTADRIKATAQVGLSRND